MITTIWTMMLQPMSRSAKIQCVGRRKSHGNVRGVVSDERLVKVKKRKIWEMKPIAPNGIVYCKRSVLSMVNADVLMSWPGEIEPVGVETG